MLTGGDLEYRYQALMLAINSHAGQYNDTLYETGRCTRDAHVYLTIESYNTRK